MRSNARPLASSRFPVAAFRNASWVLMVTGRVTLRRSLRRRIAGARVKTCECMNFSALRLAMLDWERPTSLAARSVSLLTPRSHENVRMQLLVAVSNHGVPRTNGLSRAFSSCRRSPGAVSARPTEYADHARNEAQ
jgi:hypothetical protein